MRKNFTSFDEYIATFPEETQRLLKEIRVTIKVTTPSAEEKTCYRMPTFFLNGNLKHFAAFKNLIVINPTPKRLKGYCQNQNRQRIDPTAARWAHAVEVGQQNCQI